MADYNDETINSYPSQDKRYDNEGQNKWLYKFDENFDADHTLPTFQGLNVYSAYIRNYINKQKDILQNNITNNSENISNHEQRISDLEQATMDDLAEAILNGTKNIYILKDNFYIDYKDDLNKTYIKIPIITEYFEGINDEDCIFKPNGITEDTIDELNISNLNDNETGKFNIDLASMRARFEAYLKYCYKNNDSLTQADRYNALIAWGDGAKEPNANDFTTFFSFPFKTFLPSQMADLDEGDLIYDPCSKNLYQVDFSQEKLYVYGLSEYNNDSSQILNQLWHMNVRDGQRNRTYLKNFYQNLENWIDLDEKEDRFNFAVKNLSYGLIDSDAVSIDDTKFIYVTDDDKEFVKVNQQTTCMNDGHNIKIRNYLDKRILCTYPKSTLKQARQSDNPFGALFVYCKKIGTLSNNVLWTTTKNEAEVAPYEYNINYLRQFMSSTLGIKQEIPVIGDYIYNNYSGELVEITQLPCTSELYPSLTTCLTKSIPKMELGVYSGIKCYENTYIKGINTLVKFDNQNLINSKIYNGSTTYNEIRKLFFNSSLSEIQNLYSKYLISDKGDGIKEVNALYFLQPERLNGISSLFHDYIKRILNMTIKEKDVFIDEGVLYQVIKKPYVKNIFRYQNDSPLSDEIINNYINQKGYNNESDTPQRLKYLYYLIQCLQNNNVSIQDFAQNVKALSYIANDDILKSKYDNLNEEEFNNIFLRYLNSIETYGTLIGLPLNYVILIKKIGSVLSAHSFYELAISNGYQGTELEWLDSLRGLPGRDGMSAYEIAVNEGFSGTKAEWLASLQGERGYNGVDGSDGSSLYETSTLELLSTEDQDEFEIYDINNVNKNDLDVSDQIFASQVYIDYSQNPTKTNCYYYVTSKSPISNNDAELRVKLLYELPSAEEVTSETIADVLSSYNITRTQQNETQISSPKIMGGTITGGDLIGGTITGGKLIIDQSIPTGSLEAGQIKVQKNNEVLFSADAENGVYVKGQIIATNSDIWQCTYSSYRDNQVQTEILISSESGTTISNPIPVGQKMSVLFGLSVNINNYNDVGFYINSSFTPIANLVLGEGYIPVEQFTVNRNQKIVFTFIEYNNNNYWVPDYSFSAISTTINGNTIKTGTLSASKITTGTLGANVVYSGEISTTKLNIDPLNNDEINIEDQELNNYAIYELNPNNTEIYQGIPILSITKIKNGTEDIILLKLSKNDITIMLTNLEQTEYQKIEGLISGTVVNIANDSYALQDFYIDQGDWPNDEIRYYPIEYNGEASIKGNYITLSPPAAPLTRGLKLGYGNTGNKTTQGTSLYIQATDDINNTSTQLEGLNNEIIVTERGTKNIVHYTTGSGDSLQYKTSGYWISGDTMRITAPTTKVKNLQIEGNINYQGSLLAPANSSLTSISSFDETNDNDFESILNKFKITDEGENTTPATPVLNATPQEPDSPDVQREATSPEELLEQFIDRDASYQANQTILNLNEMIQTNTVMIAYLLNKVKELESQLDSNI